MCTIYYWFPLLPFIHLWIHTACWVSWLDNSNFIHSFLETYCLLSVFFIRFGIHATCWASWLNNSDFFLLRLQSINYLVRVSFAVKNRASRSKNVWVFWTFLYCQFFTEHVLLNRWSFKHQCISKMKVKEFVFTRYFFVYLFVLPVFIMYVCLYLYLFTNTYMGPIGDSGNWWIICGTFLRKEKMAFFFLHIPEIEEIFKHF